MRTVNIAKLKQDALTVDTKEGSQIIGESMLPDKVHEILQAVHDDLWTIEKTPGIKIHMGRWIDVWFGECYVCLAGATMVCSLNINPFSYCCPSSSTDSLYSRFTRTFTFAMRKKLLLIDDIRRGKLYCAYRTSSDTFYRNLHKLENKHVEYNIDPDAFKAWLREVIVFLKAENI